MHAEQKQFCKWVKKRFFSRFMWDEVYDIGSYDVNGNNRYLFKPWTKYTGIDVYPGKNVDKVGRAIDILPTLPKTKIIISTEMLEHDNTWDKSLLAMYNALEEDGLLVITCAGEGRQEHGTTRTSPQDSPGTTDYYQNITLDMFSSVLKPGMFSEYYLKHDDRQNDVNFYGVKKVRKRIRTEIKKVWKTSATNQ